MATETTIAFAVRKNDNVLVITGRDRGKRGRVLRVIPGKGRLIVEGVNFIKRHTKANPQKNIKGGIVEREASISASNVQLVCPECGAQTRIGRKLLDDGRRVRFCVKCKGVVDK
jgi:large subunit ribosomal protein L24